MTHPVENDPSEYRVDADHVKNGHLNGYSNLHLQFDHTKEPPNVTVFMADLYTGGNDILHSEAFVVHLPTATNTMVAQLMTREASVSGGRGKKGGEIGRG